MGFFQVTHRDPNSRARTGKIETKHGIVETPSYVIVGTHAAVRTLEPEDLPPTKTQLIIANTYHLWRALGDQGLESYSGLHAAMGWEGPIMTDSGGFQVFSLGALRDQGLRRGGEGQKPDADAKSWVRVTEAGVYFHPSDAAEEEYLDAELSVKIQEQLGADIIVAFDEPTSPLHDRTYTEQSLARTHAWAERSLEARESLNQHLYGVVQGGAFEDLRRKSAQFLGNLPFEGFAIGGTYGEAYGGTREDTKNMLDWSVPFLPEDKPRHLFGVGRIEDLFLGVAAGIDTFDCVIPTREARHGRLWTATGSFDIMKSKHSEDEGPLDPACECPVCTSDTSRAELRRLFKDKNQLAGRLATIHNVYFFNDLMEQIRGAVADGSFARFRDGYLAGLKKDEAPRSA